MKSFAVCMLFKIECEGLRSDQYEEQWRLILATDEEECLKRARETATNEEDQFADRHGRIVSWRFISIKELREIEWENGALLLSTVRETEPIATPSWSYQSADLTL
jgi:hypothetical protein